MHAKTVVSGDKELFISFGVENKTWGKNRLNIPLPQKAGSVALMAIGYYVIGQIQKQNPQWFKESIEEYTEFVSKVFGSKISTIVE